MFNHWLSKYYVNDFSWDNFPQKIMGILESRPAQQTSAPTSVPSEAPREQNDEQFKTEVRKSAENFKNLVMNNKIMMFSATYCSYCTVAKKTLDDLGTQFQSMEVNKEGRQGEMMMDIVEAVTGGRHLHLRPTGAWRWLR